MSWLKDYVNAGSGTDKFTGRPDHISLLASGLFGEAGSILSELKKRKREGDAYVKGLLRIREELGDFLWYYFRIVSVVAPDLVEELDLSLSGKIPKPEEGLLPDSFQLGSAVGLLLRRINDFNPSNDAEAFREIWYSLRRIANDVGVTLEDAARGNLDKIHSRWPIERDFHPLFDDNFSEEEQIPRKLQIEFRQRKDKDVVILRCNNLNFGDQLTDNIGVKDGYRFHDIFHFSYAVFLGWSPVIRALLKCKRKSDPKIDEAEDGARAVIIEEAISAAVFNYIKSLDRFEHFEHIEFELLKMISGFTVGYEVEKVPLWQWEQALIEGYRVFRLLRENNGGTVILDMEKRALEFSPPSPIISCK